MGLFEKIFGRRLRPSVKADGFFKMLNGYTPTFRSWDGKLYESELARAVIHAKAVHVSKLSISVSGAGNPILQTRLQYGPNAWQTWGQFLYRLSTILDMQNNAFIVPVLDELPDSFRFYRAAARLNSTTASRGCVTSSAMAALPPSNTVNAAS